MPCHCHNKRNYQPVKDNLYSGLLHNRQYNADYLTSVHTAVFNILSGKLFATVSLPFSCGVPMSLPNIFCKIVYDARLVGNRTKHCVVVNALSSGTEYFASVRTFRHNSVQLLFDYIDFRGVHLVSATNAGS